MAQDKLNQSSAPNSEWGANDQLSPTSSQSGGSWGKGDKELAPEPEARGFGGWARDAAAWLTKGAISVPEAAVGLADIPTGGRVGKFLENEGGAIGFRPKPAKEIVNDWHSDAYKANQAKFAAADGIVDKAKVAIENPSLILGGVVESLPSMGAGGVVARGVAGAAGAGFLRRSRKATVPAAWGVADSAALLLRCEYALAHPRKCLKKSIA